MKYAVRRMLENSIEKSIDAIPNGELHKTRNDGTVFVTSKQLGLLACTVYGSPEKESNVVDMELSSDTAYLNSNGAVHVSYLHTIGSETDLQFDGPFKDLNLSHLVHLAIDLSAVSRQMREQKSMSLFGSSTLDS